MAYYMLSYDASKDDYPEALEDLVVLLHEQYETYDETCDDVIQLNQEGPRWRNSHFELRYSVHEPGERNLRYLINDVDMGKRFEADANSEHWIYLVSTGDVATDTCTRF